MEIWVEMESSMQNKMNQRKKADRMIISSKQYKIKYHSIKTNTLRQQKNVECKVQLRQRKDHYDVISRTHHSEQELYGNCKSKNLFKKRTILTCIRVLYKHFGDRKI